MCLIETAVQGDFPDDKIGILDVRILLQDGTQIDLKMQVTPFSFWMKRILYYISRMYTSQLFAGDSYELCQKCIHVSILTFNHLEGDECYRKMHFRDDKSGELYSDLLELQFLELKKADRNPEDSRRVVTWMRFFNGENKEDFAMLAEKDPWFKEAYETLLRISADQEKRLQYEAREKAIHDYVSQMESSRIEGEKIGEERGIEQGIKQGIKQGIGEGESRMAALITKLISAGRMEDVRKAAADPVFRGELYKEFNL